MYDVVILSFVGGLNIWVHMYLFVVKDFRQLAEADTLYIRIWVGMQAINRSRREADSVLTLNLAREALFIRFAE